MRQQREALEIWHAQIMECARALQWNLESDRVEIKEDDRSHTYDVHILVEPLLKRPGEDELLLEEKETDELALKKLGDNDVEYDVEYVVRIEEPIKAEKGPRISIARASHDRRVHYGRGEGPPCERTLIPSSELLCCIEQHVWAALMMHIQRKHKALGSARTQKVISEAAFKRMADKFDAASRDMAEKFNAAFEAVSRETGQPRWNLQAQGERQMPELRA